MKNQFELCWRDKKSQKDIKLIADFLNIIAEENRLKILCLLSSGKKCVCQIWQYLKLPQNLTSHHLKVLKDFGLLSSKKEGQKIFYQLNQKTIKKYLNLLNNFLILKGEKNDD
jgi:ArsR family transcriptional regulator